MHTIKSFKGYGKVDEAEQQAYQKKTRKRIIILTVSSLILLAAIIAAVAGIVIHKRNTKSSSPSSNSVPTPELTPAASLKAVCDVTQHPSSCFSAISSVAASNTTDPKLLFRLSLQVAIDELSKLSKQLPSKLRESAKNDSRLQKAIGVCETVFDDALDHLNESIGVADEGRKVLAAGKITDLETWLSAAITNQETCIDAISEVDSFAARGVLGEAQTAMQNSTEYASNSLAIVTRILGLISKFDAPVHRRRRLLGFPEWVSASDRKLLAANVNETKTHVVVAQDGSGDFSTITAAVQGLKKKSLKRQVIYVKAGIYKENIDLDKNTWNVMIYGDGKTKTLVSGSRNFIDGTATFGTATFAVKGKGFIARDIGFVNSAGASKHQAVALRSGSDRSVFYRCSFDGFQDTLYAHSNRQFYRECDITGTIDFIFGNAAVVFQSCRIMPRQPLPNQFNTITAQGKKDPNQNTGIVIQKSSITTLDKDNLTAPTYLGRPWKEYSTTVIMQSDIGPFLKPVGWVSWIPNVEPANTIFYAEYQNSGPGSDVSLRVKWAGYKPTLTDLEAGKYTVQSFIQGPEWLKDASVQFESTL